MDSWTPPEDHNTKLDLYINRFRKRVRSEILTKQQKLMYSLTPAERQAVTSLKKNSNIVVKPADKGGATVIMNKADYITEADRQLSNAAFYSPLTRDPTPAYRREPKSLLCTLPVDVQWQINDMTPQDPRPGTFYLLPKIHKVGNPGCSIVSGIGTITEGVSGFVDTVVFSAHMP